MKVSVAKRRSRFGFFWPLGSVDFGHSLLPMFEPPLRSRRRDRLSVRLVGLLMMGNELQN